MLRPFAPACRLGTRVARATRSRVAVFAAAAAVSAGAAELPPVSAFTDPPRFDHASLSPGGRLFARSGLDGGTGRVMVMTYPQGEAKLDLALRDGRRVSGMHWQSDETLVFDVLRPPKSTYDTQCGATEWGSDAYEVWLFDVKSGRYNWRAYGRVADMLADDAESFLLEGCDGAYPVNARRSWRGSVRPSDAGYRGLARFPAAVLAHDGYVADRRGRVVFNVATNEDFERQVFRHVDGRWQRVPPARGGGDWVPLRPGPDSGTWYALETTATGTLGLALGRAADHGVSLAAHPEVDVSRVLFDGGRPYAVQFEPGRPETRYLEPTRPLARLHAQLARLFPAQRVTITSWTADYRRALAVVEGDRTPGELVLVNGETGYVERLMSRRPGLKPSALAPMTPVAFAAHDGTTVHAYVTGHPARRPGAMVVLVHDGPHGVRDVWGFDAVGQLLASRGYQVLQVNFRGSGGYGSAYARHGFGAWGGLMQDDVTDATRWAIEAGIADPDRICIMGSGYGGYAALIGVVRAPGTYRCAVAVGGIYDLASAAQGREYNFRLPGLRQTRERVGHAGLDALSPMRRAAAVDVPVLLAHGTEDGRAPPRQARRMRKALAQAGNPADWMPLAGAGHTIRDADKRSDLYERVLGFLRSHAAPD